MEADNEPENGRKRLEAALEAILMVAEEPLSPEVLALAIECAPSEVEELCEGLAAQYQAQGRGFVLVRVGGGYRYQTAKEQAHYVERFLAAGQSRRLSNAALETLAIVAYKQPISRNQIAAIRGVNVDGVVRTLAGRGYIVEVSRAQGPGQAALYGTTQEFCERMGIDSVADLEPLTEFFPSAEVVEELENITR